MVPKMTGLFVFLTFTQKLFKCMFLNPVFHHDLPHTFSHINDIIITQRKVILVSQECNLPSFFHMGTSAFHNIFLAQDR